MVGCFGGKFRSAYVELSQIFKENLCVILGYLVWIFVLLARSLLHFIFAVVRVGKKMTYVRNVHYALYFIALVPKRSSKQVHKNVGAKITYVRIVVNGRSAGIHPYAFTVHRRKIFFFPRQSVVKFHNIFTSRFVFFLKNGVLRLI